MRSHGDGLVLSQQPGDGRELARMADLIDHHQPLAADPGRVPGFSKGPDPFHGTA